MAEYKVESIGAAFSDRDVKNLGAGLTQQSNAGWELHTVFSIEKKGCFGASEGTTYLAVFRKDT